MNAPLLRDENIPLTCYWDWFSCGIISGAITEIVWECLSIQHSNPSYLYLQIVCTVVGDTDAWGDVADLEKLFRRSTNICRRIICWEIFAGADCLLNCNWYLVWFFDRWHAWCVFLSQVVFCRTNYFVQIIVILRNSGTEIEYVQQFLAIPCLNVGSRSIWIQCPTHIRLSPLLCQQQRWHDNENGERGTTETLWL